MQDIHIALWPAARRHPPTGGGEHPSLTSQHLTTSQRGSSSMGIDISKNKMERSAELHIKAAFQAQILVCPDPKRHTERRVWELL